MIEQHQPYHTTVNSGAPEGQAVPVSQVASVVLKFRL